MKIVIIEDNQEELNHLSKILAKRKNNQIIGTIRSVEEAEIFFKTNRDFDLLIMDVELPDGTGFDVLQSIDFQNFQLIVVSSHDNYALKAFNFAAVDFVLKPYSETDLLKALSRTEKNHKNSFKTTEVLKENMIIDNPYHSKIAISTAIEIRFVVLSDIIYCKADGNYTEFYLVDNSRIISSKPIKYFDELLCDHNYFRVHKSYLINLSHVVAYKRQNGGQLLMSNDHLVDISKLKKDLLLTEMSKF